MNIDHKELASKRRIEQPEALRLANVCSNLTRYSMEAHLIAAELRRQHARIAELEAQLESIGAGGVSGPLMGQPQAPLGGRWYMVNRDGMATLCTDRADAEKEAADAQIVWPHMGPHRAVQLVEVGASARGLIDAAQAVIDRWDTPLWKDVEPTAAVIGRLRAAVAAEHGGES